MTILNIQIGGKIKNIVSLNSCSLCSFNYRKFNCTHPAPRCVVSQMPKSVRVGAKSFCNVMNQSISKLAKFYSHAVLSREEQTKITGGLAAINCTFNVGGLFNYGGACASANMSLCVQAAGAQASLLSFSSGLSVDFSCSGSTANVE